MAAIRGFGAYLPTRVVTNGELAARLDCEPGWILDVSGIEERRYADPAESVASMGVFAASQCLECAGVKANDVGMVLVSSGSSERRFPGPASAIAHALKHGWRAGHRLTHRQRRQFVRHGIGCVALRDPRQYSGRRVRENVRHRFPRTLGAGCCASVRRRRGSVLDRRGGWSGEDRRFGAPLGRHVRPGSATRFYSAVRDERPFRHSAGLAQNSIRYRRVARKKPKVRVISERFP